MSKEININKKSKNLDLLTDEDLGNLDIIFGYAKRYMLDNDDNLAEVLKAKKEIIPKLCKIVKDISIENKKK